MKDWKRDVYAYSEIISRNCQSPQTAIEVHNEITILSAERNRHQFLSPEWAKVNEELTKHVQFVYAMSSFNDMLKKAEHVPVKKGLV